MNKKIKLSASSMLALALSLALAASAAASSSINENCTFDSVCANHTIVTADEVDTIDNIAVALPVLDQESNTGENVAEGNINTSGGDASIETGDADVEFDLDTDLNSYMVSSFGDFLADASFDAVNSGISASDAQNILEIINYLEQVVTNDATYVADVTGLSNTGFNTVSGNVDNGIIVTGDASIESNSDVALNNAEGSEVNPFAELDLNGLNKNVTFGSTALNSYAFTSELTYDFANLGVVNEVYDLTATTGYNIMEGNAAGGGCCGDDNSSGENLIQTGDASIENDVNYVVNSGSFVQTPTLDLGEIDFQNCNVSSSDAVNQAVIDSDLTLTTTNEAYIDLDHTAVASTGYNSMSGNIASGHAIKTGDASTSVSFDATANSAE